MNSSKKVDLTKMNKATSLREIELKSCVRYRELEVENMIISIL